MLLIDAILQGKNLPSGENGYHFAVAHRFHWWQTLDRIAESLKSRGLVTSAEVRPWQSDEIAAEALGLPVPFMNIIWNSL